MTTLLLIGLCLVVFAVVTFLYSYAINWEVRRRAQVSEYDRRHAQIQEHIRTSLRCRENYDLIMKQISCIGKYPGCNKEKQQQLFMNCANHFQEIVKYDFVNECEKLNT